MTCCCSKKPAWPMWRRCAYGAVAVQVFIALIVGNQEWLLRLVTLYACFEATHNALRGDE